MRCQKASPLGSTTCRQQRPGSTGREAIAAPTTAPPATAAGPGRAHVRKLTQRAIARECAEWIRRKGKFRSNRGKSPMQQFAHVNNGGESAVYLPLHGFTAVDLGFQKGDAISNFVHKMSDAPTTAMRQPIRADLEWPERLEDVTGHICDHIDSVYRENSMRFRKNYPKMCLRTISPDKSIRAFGTSCIPSSAMPPRGSAISWRAATAASWPIAWIWAKPSPPSRDQVL